MKISVVGLGKLGLPLAAILSRAGHEVIGVDKNAEFVSKINAGLCPVQEPGLAELLNGSTLTATGDTSTAVLQTDVTFVVVPTPSDSKGEFSNSFVLDAFEQIGDGLSRKTSEHTVVVTSTIMPGASEMVLIPALEAASSRMVGQRLHYCYSPEFIALGSVLRDMYNPDFVLIGQSSERAGNVLSFVYQSFLSNHSPIISRVDLIDAEIAKLAVNCYLTIKISFANMISEYCEGVPGADALAVCRVIGHDSRIGSKFLRPGTAAGGPCLPRDLQALNTVLFDSGVEGELIEAAISVNTRQVSRLKHKVLALKPKKVAVLGMAYKPGTHVADCSVGRDLVDRLRHGGTTVDWYDPLVVGGANAAEDAMAGADVVVITTADPEFSTVRYGDRTVLDCWGVACDGDNIVQLGRNVTRKINDLYR